MARDSRGCNYFVTDLDALLAGLPESAVANIKADIRQKMLRAERGECTFGRGRHYDVDEIESTRLVLELRIVDHNALDPDDPEGDMVQRHTRIYFTEPEHVPDLLLLMSVRSKCPGPEGLQEQTDHAGDAQTIAEEHGAREL